MKWGVRRTPEQLGHHRKTRTSSVRDIKKVISKLGSDDFSDFGKPSAIYYKNVEYDDNDEPIGFSILIPHNERGKKVVDISLAVVPEHRREGLAKKMAKKAIDEVSKDPTISKVYWGAEKDNISSINLAKSLDFKWSYDTDYYTIYEIDPHKKSKQN